MLVSCMFVLSILGHKALAALFYPIHRMQGIPQQRYRIFHSDVPALNQVVSREVLRGALSRRQWAFPFYFYWQVCWLLNPQIRFQPLSVGLTKGGVDIPRIL